MHTSKIIVTLFVTLLLFVPLLATENIIKAVMQSGECLSTCCCLKVANIGYDSYCNGLGCKNSILTSPEYTMGVRWFTAINTRCCALERPSWCMEITNDPRASLTVKQKWAQCLYNCCLFKTISVTRAYCCYKVPCMETIQTLGEYKIGKTIVTCCLNNPYYAYGVLGTCGCLLCVGGAFTVMQDNSTPHEVPDMNYAENNYDS